MKKQGHLLKVLIFSTLSEKSIEFKNHISGAPIYWTIWLNFFFHNNFDFVDFVDLIGNFCLMLTFFNLTILKLLIDYPYLDDELE